MASSELKLATRHLPFAYLFAIAHAGSIGPNASSPEILVRI
jgi:hypothetical protein